MNQEFKTLHDQSAKYGETNDCSVKMIALVLGTSYENAWNLARKWGREPRKGMNTIGTVIPKLREMGLNIWECASPARTIKTFERCCRSGKFIIRTSGHVLYNENGKTYDWTEGRQHRIENVFRVEGTAAGHPDFNPECTELEHDFQSRKILASPLRTRKTQYCWKLVYVGTGEVVARYKRRPEKIANALKQGRLSLRSRPDAALRLEQMRAPWDHRPAEVVEDGRFHKVA